MYVTLELLDQTVIDPGVDRPRDIPIPRAEAMLHEYAKDFSNTKIWKVEKYFLTV